MPWKQCDSSASSEMNQNTLAGIISLLSLPAAQANLQARGCCPSLCCFYPDGLLQPSQIPKVVCSDNANPLASRIPSHTHPTHTCGIHAWAKDKPRRPKELVSCLCKPWTSFAMDFIRILSHLLSFIELWYQRLSSSICESSQDSLQRVIWGSTATQGQVDE